MYDDHLLLAGSVAEYDLADVLQVLWLSRQLTAVELQLEDGGHCGTIWLKSGHVVGARRGATQGKAAFYDLVGRRNATFRVVRLADPPTFPEPLGAIETLLAARPGG
jgi:hypothetical protein